jgi:hypothetical protein
MKMRIAISVGIPVNEVNRKTGSDLIKLEEDWHLGQIKSWRKMLYTNVVEEYRYCYNKAKMPV